MDSLGNVYVAGTYSDNVFRITPGGTITEIMDSTGDGIGNELNFPSGIAIDSEDNIYITSLSGSNVFQISDGGVI